MIANNLIRSVEELISKVKIDHQSWGSETFPWFRGEPAFPENYYDGKPAPLLPELYRYPEGTSYENRLLQHFRMKAPVFGDLNTPNVHEVDKWLFLARHVGLPTRLLDWTESLLAALFFATHTSGKGAVVWMLDPIRLNALSTRVIKQKKAAHQISRLRDNAFDLTWLSHDTRPPNRQEMRHEMEALLNSLSNRHPVNFTCPLSRFSPDSEMFKAHIGKANANIRGAWETDSIGTDFPVAIHPTNIHTRMSTQKSCFTIHGIDKRSLLDLVANITPPILFKYDVDPRKETKIKAELRLLGITQSSLMPDLDGLARDIVEAFLPSRTESMTEQIKM